MENCIFCQIIAGDLPACKVYEDEHVLAFLDITQVTKGHTLVIPKQHVRNILDMKAETAIQVFRKVPDIARSLQQVTGATGLNILNNSEEVAGQTVFHAHIHLIPRFDQTDGFKVTFQTNEPDFPAMTTLAEQVSKGLDQ